MIEIAVPSVVVIIASFIYWMNPPALFGYLTIDNTICDMTEAAFVLIVLTVNDRLDIRVAGIVILMSCAAGIIMITLFYKIKGTFSIMYAACVVADIVSVMVLAAMSRVKGHKL